MISCLKSIFFRHGIPEIVRSDNEPQYLSAEFMRFASSYSFQHLTSSPKFPQSNGQAKRAVRTVKNLLNISNDPYTSLLSDRATPLSCVTRELSMGRRLRTSVPQTDKMLIPQCMAIQREGRGVQDKAEEKFRLETPSEGSTAYT